MSMSDYRTTIEAGKGKIIVRREYRVSKNKWVQVDVYTTTDLTIPRSRGIVWRDVVPVIGQPESVELTDEEWVYYKAGLDKIDEYVAGFTA